MKQQIHDTYTQLAETASVRKLAASKAQYTDDDYTFPDRLTTAVERIVRDTAKGRALKAHYDHRCQVCGTGIQLLGREVAYVEVHHLIPLGHPFRGNDDWNNMIVVCPNCHTAFDYGSYRIHPTTLQVHTVEGQRSIKFVPGHELSSENVLRHWEARKLRDAECMKFLKA